MPEARRTGKQAAHKDPYGVTVGGVLGHALCTGLAVLGGRMLAARISEKTTTLCGGALFLLFAIHGYVTIGASCPLVLPDYRRKNIRNDSRTQSWVQRH
jgi:hypothetical protein